MGRRMGDRDAGTQGVWTFPEKQRGPGSGMKQKHVTVGSQHTPTLSGGEQGRFLPGTQAIGLTQGPRDSVFAGSHALPERRGHSTGLGSRMGQLGLWAVGLGPQEANPTPSSGVALDTSVDLGF